MKRIPGLLLSVVFIFLISTASAQVVISGYVVSQSRDSLASATIRLKKDSASIVSIAYAVSDKNGFFQLTAPKDLASAVVEVTTVGYQTALVPVLLEKNNIE